VVLTEDELAAIRPALLADASIAIALIDHERRIRYVNRVEHGYQRRELQDIQIDALLPPHDRERITRILDGVLRTGVPASYETRSVTPAGPVLYVVRVSALRVAGEIRYAILFSLDITEEYQRLLVTERDLAVLAALERINRIMLAGPTAEPMFDRVLAEMLEIFRCERALLAYPCDPQAAEINNFFEQTAPGFARRKGARPIDAATAARLALALRHRGEVVRSDPEHDPIPEGDPEDSSRVRSMLYVAVFSEADKPWLLAIQHCRQAQVYDAEVPLLSAIAARIGDGLRMWQTQQAMRQGEERFRLQVEHAPEAIVILDMATGKFIEVNSKATELFGMSREQLLQVGPLELSPPTQADGSRSVDLAMPRIAAALSGESPVFEWLHTNASGQLLECEVRLLHLPHPEHQWVRGSILHIADRKRAQRENERLSLQLAQAQKMEAIGHLTGGVAHDFNNLLTVITGSLEMMAMGIYDDGHDGDFRTLALDACKRASQLTQRLLAFSRQQPLRPRSVDVAALLSDIRSLLASTLGETIQIQLLPSPDLWPCEVDPAQLESAILNLSINARDAMPSGGRLVLEASNTTVEEPFAHAVEDLDAGEYVVVAVSDDGTGIPPEILGRVFDPFFTTKGVGKGSGLGLSMVYGFAKQSRGHVKIYSEIGHGTTVKLFLPRSRDKSLPVAARDAGANGPPGNRELLLVVEDDPALRALVVQLLHRLGYRTVAAGDAASALRLLAAEDDVALLLADMVLPGGKNGAELSREAKALRPDLPVLFMSGYTENAVIHNGRLDPGVRLLEKPFTTSKLAEAVRQALSGRSAR
jgi:PAS domain S-box-containing protein